jgi:hypothetical protein
MNRGDNGLQHIFFYTFSKCIIQNNNVYNIIFNVPLLYHVIRKNWKWFEIKIFFFYNNNQSIQIFSYIKFCIEM